MAARPPEIRPATRTDLRAVVELSRAWKAEGTCQAYQGENAEELAERLGEYFLIAESEHRLLGFVIAEVKPTAGNEFIEGVLDDESLFLEVQTLYVAVEWRRQGVGGALLDAVLRRAERNGVRGSHVYSANLDYIRTAAFYEKHGYRMWHIQMTRKA